MKQAQKTQSRAQGAAVKTLGKTKKRKKQTLEVGTDWTYIMYGTNW